MTDLTDIVNIGLQYLGTRTTITAANLANNDKNEAIQANLILTKLRDQTLRMAPWNCALNTANLTYITSTPGTPENTSTATTLWQKGQPPPPWAYEYQYPVDCLRPCWLIPAQQTGYTGSTTSFSGVGPTPWSGGPIIYKVQIDQFYPLISVDISSPGTDYVVGDIITLESGAAGSPPIGAPAQVRVATIGPDGVIVSATVVNQIAGSATPKGGSYFNSQTAVITQGSTTGVGTGAVFLPTFGPKSDQRVILCNQEFATLAYVKQVTDPNVMDDLFLNAWSAILGARLCMALTGDKTLAKMLAGAAIDDANSAVARARTADGNEGLTINDVTPDWIRVRGINFLDYGNPFAQGFDWGPLWSTL